MSRILAIDYGQKRVGLAVSDPMKIIASALETVDTKNLMEYLKKYISNNDVETIVVGMPLQTDGSPSPSQSYILPFMGRLRKEFPDMKITTADERYTSKLAHHALSQCGVSKNKIRQNKGIVDKIAAVIILQDWMEANKF